MHVLSDDGGRTLEFGTTYVGQPTRAAIIAQLQWLVQGVVPGDVLLFHFSGHGAQEIDPTGAEEDGLGRLVCHLTCRVVSSDVSSHRR